MNEETSREKPTREFLSTVYIIKDGKVLLTFNKKLQKFTPIGGHIEQNETPCESVVREAKEESGLNIELINPKESNNRNLPQNFDIGLDIIKPDHHHINISYIGKIIGGKQLEKSDEDTELKWFSPKELKSCDETFDNIKQAGLKALEIVNQMEQNGD